MRRVDAAEGETDLDREQKKEKIMQSLIRWTPKMGFEIVVMGVIRSHISMKVNMGCNQHQNEQRQFGRIRKMNSLYAHKS